MADHLKSFDANALLALDEGAIAKAIDIELKKIFGDIIDRPASTTGKTKSRTLVLQVEITPVCKEDKTQMARWVVDHVNLVPQVSSKIPAVKGGINHVKLTVGRDPKTGSVGVISRWNPSIPDDLDQPGLFEEDPLDAVK